MKTFKEWLQNKKGAKQFKWHGTDTCGDEQVMRLSDGSVFVWMDNVIDKNNRYWSIDRFDLDGINVHLITMGDVNDDLTVNLDEICIPINEIENTDFDPLDDV